MTLLYSYDGVGLEFWKPREEVAQSNTIRRRSSGAPPSNSRRFSHESGPTCRPAAIAALQKRAGKCRRSSRPETLYEPLVDPDALRQPLEKPRELPGMDWNIRGQLDVLESFRFARELDGIPDRWQDDLSFHFNNGAFENTLTQGAWRVTDKSASHFLPRSSLIFFVNSSTLVLSTTRVGIMICLLAGITDLSPFNT